MSSLLNLPVVYSLLFLLIVVQLVILNSQYVQQYGHYGLVYGSKNKTIPECTPGLQLPQGHFITSHNIESGTTR